MKIRLGVRSDANVPFDFESPSRLRLTMTTNALNEFGIDSGMLSQLTQHRPASVHVAVSREALPVLVRSADDVVVRILDQQCKRHRPHVELRLHMFIREDAGHGP